jgi:hypothetical protein
MSTSVYTGLNPFNFIRKHFCRSAFGKSLCTYKSCWKWCPRASIQAWTKATYRSRSAQRLSERTVYVYNTCKRRCKQPTFARHAHLYFHHNADWVIYFCDLTYFLYILVLRVSDDNGQCYRTVLPDSVTGQCYQTVLPDRVTGQCYRTHILTLSQLFRCPYLAHSRPVITAVINVSASQFDSI